jgi:hypothetical protein
LIYAWCISRHHIYLWCRVYQLGINIACVLVEDVYQLVISIEDVYQLVTNINVAYINWASTSRASSSRCFGYFGCLIAGLVPSINFFVSKSHRSISLLASPIEALCPRSCVPQNLRLTVVRAPGSRSQGLVVKILCALGRAPGPPGPMRVGSRTCRPISVIVNKGPRPGKGRARVRV